MISKCKEGVYGAKICWKGVMSEIIIDDHFPYKLDGTPCFTRSRGDELWVLILEKIWAKLHGSYC